MKLRTPGIKIRCKPKEIMGDCIALHGLMTAEDIKWWECLPDGKHQKIPQDEIWIRDDHCKNNEIPEEDKGIAVHEDAELLLMKYYGLPYKIAHPIAKTAEERWKKFQLRNK